MKKLKIIKNPRVEDADPSKIYFLKFMTSIHVGHSKNTVKNAELRYADFSKQILKTHEKRVSGIYVFLKIIERFFLVLRKMFFHFDLQKYLKAHNWRFSMSLKKSYRTRE